MKSIELGELAIDLRLKYKMDTELKWENKYPLTVFRSRQATSVKVRYDSIMKLYDIGIVKSHPANVKVDDLDEYTEYIKKLNRNDTVVLIVKHLGL